jgi:hypothetical protein
MRAIYCFFLLVLACTAVRAAELVPIRWGEAQRFELQRALPAGQVLEVCGPLAAGQAVDWQFVASAPLAFNIHHHVGKRVFYAERRQRTKSLTARFAPAEAAEYCWMWTAKTDTQLQLLLRR